MSAGEQDGEVHRQVGDHPNHRSAWQPRLVTRDDLAKAWEIISFGPDLARLRPVGPIIQVWSDVPTVAEASRQPQVAIDCRLSALLQQLAEQCAGST